MYVLNGYMAVPRRELAVSIGNNLHERLRQTIHVINGGFIPDYDQPYEITNLSSGFKIDFDVLFDEEVRGVDCFNWLNSLVPHVLLSESNDDHSLRIVLQEFNDGDLGEVVVELELNDRPTGQDQEDFDNWSQPTGAHNSYSEGNVVIHGTRKWVSVVSGNVWMPGIFGWEVYESDGNGNGNGNGEDYPDWVQPQGSHDAYDEGAIVKHNDLLWINVYGDGNVWEPGQFGWEEYDAGT